MKSEPSVISEPVNGNARRRIARSCAALGSSKRNNANLANDGRVISRIMKPSESHIVIETKTAHRGSLSQWRGHHAFLCDVNRFSTEWLYRSLGCNQLVVKQVECVAKGHKACTTLVTWSE